jgi:hypothetical protein
MSMLIIGGVIVAIAVITSLGGQRALKADPDLEAIHH